MLAKVNHESTFTFVKHKTCKYYGPLKKWDPHSVVQALKVYQAPLVATMNIF